MLGWTDEQLMYRKAVRRFVETEVAPPGGDRVRRVPPFGILRKFYADFGVGESAMERFEATMSGGEKPPRNASEKLIRSSSFSRYCPGLVTALGVSVGLTAGAIMSKGTTTQKERWALPVSSRSTKIGAWAITEPGSGSDAFGAMKSTARRDGGGYVLNGNKTFITNGPYADTIVFICKLDDGTARRSSARW